MESNLFGRQEANSRNKFPLQPQGSCGSGCPGMEE